MRQAPGIKTKLIAAFVVALATLTAGAAAVLAQARIIEAPPPTEPAAPPPGVAPTTGRLTLLVIGDFMGSNLAEGLEDSFGAGVTRLEIIDRTNGSSGLVRTDYFNWNAELPAILASVQPDYVAVMIGANDRQEIRLSGRTVPLRSAEWDRLYAARVTQLAAAIGAYGKPALWVGQPPMRPRSMSADMAYFNSLYRTAIEAVGGLYVDIWDAFADEDGRFTATGPDIDGRNRLLRTDDGFGLTAAGRAKLAFYVDREIPAPGAGTTVAAVTPAVPVAPAAEPAEPVAPEPGAGPVLPLTAPPPGAPTELLDAVPAMGTATLPYALFVRGVPIPTVAGRADDFRWPPAVVAPVGP